MQILKGMKDPRRVQAPLYLHASFNKIRQKGWFITQSINEDLTSDSSSEGDVRDVQQKTYYIE
jgi:hypothetical protein